MLRAGQAPLPPWGGTLRCLVLAHGNHRLMKSSDADKAPLISLLSVFFELLKDMDKVNLGIIFALSSVKA